MKKQVTFAGKDLSSIYASVEWRRDELSKQPKQTAIIKKAIKDSDRILDMIRSA